MAYSENSSALASSNGWNVAHQLRARRKLSRTAGSSLRSRKTMTFATGPYDPSMWFITQTTRSRFFRGICDSHVASAAPMMSSSGLGGGRSRGARGSGNGIAKLMQAPNKFGNCAEMPFGACVSSYQKTLSPGKRVAFQRICDDLNHVAVRHLAAPVSHRASAADYHLTQTAVLRAAA